MDFVPTLVKGGVVLNAMEICDYDGTDCRSCPDVAVGVHNWLISCEVRYLVVDFGDEKEVCHSILIELLQLRKRLRIPFLFVGLMEKPQNILRSYDYHEHPFFSIPEEAIAYLQQFYSLYMNSDVSNINFDKPIPCSRYKYNRLDYINEDSQHASL